MTRSTLIAVLLLAQASAAVAQQAPARTPDLVLPVSCSSTTAERQHCLTDTANGVTLLKATAGECILGRTWGYDATGVWVSDGCSGEFVSGTVATALAATSVSGPDDDSVLRKFEGYGSLRAQLAYFDENAEIQDNASRVGVLFSTGEAVSFFAGAELGMNLTRSQTQFNAGANTSGGFVTLDQIDAPIFAARLGYVGVDFGWFGRVSAGKQNGMHYDVTSYTDRYNVFGANTSFTFVAGTDGGTTGTGRADSVVQYRNKLFKVFEVGGQVQFRGAANDDVIDGYGASAQLTVLPGVKIGATATRTMLRDDLKNGQLLGLDDDPMYYALGVKGDWDIISLGVVYARQTDGDLVRLPSEGLLPLPVVYDGQSLEAVARFRVSKFGVVTGFTYMNPDSDLLIIARNFRIRQFMGGIELGVAKNAYAYVEARYDDSFGPQGENAGSVIIAGLRYDFSLRGAHRR